MSMMDLLQLAKVCRSEEETFQFLFERRRELTGYRVQDVAELTTIRCIREDFVARTANEIITRSPVHYLMN